MSATQTTTRKRGRPRTGTARTAAQRMEQTRLRALEALRASTDPDLSAVSTTGLFEALRVAYKQPNAWDMASVTAELFKRANERTKHPVAVTFRDAREVRNSATVSVNQAPEAEQISATVADISPTVSADNPATVAEKERGYPVEIKRMAVEMFDAGADTREIRQVILDQLGRAPRMDNIKRQIDEQWRKALAKAEAAL